MVCMEETMAETGRMKELIDILNKAASVYYQGKEMDIEGKSGINTLRIVLNEIFMTNYEMLDNPEKYLYQYK